MKKNIYLLACAMLTVLVIFLGRNSLIYAAVKAGTKFEDWVVVCEPNDVNSKDSISEKEVCYLSQFFQEKYMNLKGIETRENLLWRHEKHLIEYVC